MRDTGARTFNLADLFEQAVDAFPDREYLVVGDQRVRLGSREPTLRAELGKPVPFFAVGG